MFGNNYLNGYGYNPNYNMYNQSSFYPNYNNQQNAIPTPPVNQTSTNTNKIFVNGLEDVRNMRLNAGSDFMFLDNDKPLLYQKIVDSKGQFEVKTFDIIPHVEKEENKKTDSEEFVSKKELDKLYEKIKKLEDQIIKQGGNNNESSKKSNKSNAE